jgi:hypothetical protein
MKKNLIYKIDLFSTKWETMKEEFWPHANQYIAILVMD